VLQDTFWFGLRKESQKKVTHGGEKEESLNISDIKGEKDIAGVGLAKRKPDQLGIKFFI